LYSRLGELHTLRTAFKRQKSLATAGIQTSVVQPVIQSLYRLIKLPHIRRGFKRRTFTTSGKSGLPGWGSFTPIFMAFNYPYNYFNISSFYPSLFGPVR
jgi:hypothetical protein